MGYLTAAKFEHTEAAKIESREIVAVFMKERGRPPDSLAELEEGPQVNLFAIYRYAIIDAIAAAQTVHGRRADGRGSAPDEDVS